MQTQFDTIARWLIGEGRLSGDSLTIVQGFSQRLVAIGVPLWRLRVNQRMSNPLIAAWGVIWRRDQEAPQEYLVPTELLSTSAWIGSPFQYVFEHRTNFRRRLRALDAATDHSILHELAADGATDFLAMPIEYGDGSVQGMSAVTDHPDGFSEEQIALLEALREPFSAALEPSAMRRSTASLLRTYLGNGPAGAVVAGAVRRGDISRIQAVVMVSDLRGFTDKSFRWPEDQLLTALGSYFELLANAITAHGGDILKFMGDGLLAVFPIGAENTLGERCAAALDAAREAREALRALNVTRVGTGNEPLDFGTSLHLGQVTYGNVGSPDRLDFTIIGDAVNVASRIEALCKPLAEPILVSPLVAKHLSSRLRSLGHHPIRGLPEPLEMWAP